MRRLITTLLILLIAIPILQAQDNPVEIPALQDSESVEATFAEDVTTHLYAFNASAGDSITITMTQSDNDLDPFLVLFNSDGEVIAADDDSGDVSLAAAITGVNIEDDGVYFVMATSVLFVDAFEVETDDDLAYTLSISGQTTPESVEDGDIVSVDATRLAIGDSLNGESTEDAPLALFYLDLAEGDEVTISLEDADFFTLLHVFAPDGDRLAADASLAQIEADEAGIYIIIATEQFFYEAMNEAGFFEGGAFTLVIE